MYSGIKERILNNKKLLTGKGTTQEKEEAKMLLKSHHEAIRHFINNSNVQIPFAVLVTLEDRMIELSQAISKIIE